MPFLSLGDAMRSHVADGDCVHGFLGSLGWKAA